MGPRRPAGRRGAESGPRTWRLLVPPLIGGLLAALATFVAVGALTRGDDPGRAAAPAPGVPPAHAGAAIAPGRGLFARMGCGNCHRLAAANSQGQIGPDLDERLSSHTRASLVSKILDPYPDLPADVFTVMPEDYGKRMSAAELDALVSFLLAVRRPPESG